jgi:hypothetical protein
MSRPTELSEQINVVRSLRAAGILFAAIPNGGRRDAREGRMLKASGVVAGVPDLLIFTRPPNQPDKCGVALEMKRSGGKPSDVSKAQRQWIENLEQLGWICIVGYGTQNALQHLRDLGFPV